MAKSLLQLKLSIGLYFGLAIFATQSHSQEFPSSCEMSASERQERAEVGHMERISKYMLSEMPSVIDDCAFGDRLKSAMDGLISAVFDKIPSFSLDGDFFCGFGAQDAWALGTTVAGQEGRRDYASWWNDSRKNARNEAGAISRMIPGQTALSDGGSGLNEDNVFLRVGDKVWSGQDDGH